MKIAFVDCFSGISGDMFLGALIDAGLPFNELKRAIGTFPLKGYGLHVRKEERSKLFGTRFLVRVERGSQVERGLGEIKKIIQAGHVSNEVKDKSIGIFESLAHAEGKIHNRSPEEVHFHEVGSVDSIIDIVGSVFGIEFLGIASISASSVPLGSGFTDTEHGKIPVPAPATISLLRDIPVHDSGLKTELVTPTGAALIKNLAGSFGTMPSMKVGRIGYGVGSRKLADRPNLLRIIIGHDQLTEGIETVIILEANLDDTNPEWMGFVMERLFEAGALDVIFCPVQMKKNRPAILIQVIGRPHQKDILMDILFRESTTLGVRFRYCQRKIIERSLVEIDSPWGKMTVKKIMGPDGSPFFMPEYEACRKIAEKNGLPIKEIYYWVMSSARNELKTGASTFQYSIS